jgi:aryl-alcohol dehydrogenase-like predicted oxidoreductase
LVTKQNSRTDFQQWDTANGYSNGDSERIMGKALKKFGIPRNKVIIMTKCFRMVCDPENYDPAATVLLHHELADYSKDYVNQCGMSSAACRSSSDV